LLITGCGGSSSSGGNSNPNNKLPVVTITEDITEPTTFTTGKVYVIPRVHLYIKNKLTIEPGTIIKTHDYMWEEIITDNGLIEACGTADKPIIFTSYRDDTHGGDTNNNGNSNYPQAYNWAGFWFQSTLKNDLKKNKFEYCQFLYGGGGNNRPFFNIDCNINITFNNCIFAHNGGDKTYDNGGNPVISALEWNINLQINDCTFYDNNYPILINSIININNSNIFHNPTNPKETNKSNAIFIYPNCAIDKAVYWAEDEIPFVILAPSNNSLEILENGSLNLSDNVILKLKKSMGIEYYGKINGYDKPGVFFTAYNDDRHGGDTNGDGLSIGTEDYWRGIQRCDLHGKDIFETWDNILFAKNH